MALVGHAGSVSGVCVCVCVWTGMDLASGQMKRSCVAVHVVLLPRPHGRSAV